MLSGIGPRAHLKAHGIKVKVDLERVGKNLQDHQLYRLGPFDGTGSMRLVLFLSSRGNKNKNAYADQEWFNLYFTQASTQLPLILNKLNYSAPYAQHLLEINQNFDVM